jgi:hypothetical protein
MGLATNNCKKHGGYVEEQCPTCVADDYAKAVASMKKFFGYEHSIELNGGYSVSVEELFQHFRIRLLEEIGQ